MAAADVPRWVALCAPRPHAANAIWSLELLPGTLFDSDPWEVFRQTLGQQ
jgi:hypothetical protein